jgi:hypothetical protein
MATVESLGQTRQLLKMKSKYNYLQSPNININLKQPQRASRDSQRDRLIIDLQTMGGQVNHEHAIRRRKSAAKQQSLLHTVQVYH